MNRPAKKVTAGEQVQRLFDSWSGSSVAPRDGSRIHSGCGSVVTEIEIDRFDSAHHWAFFSDIPQCA